MTAPFDGEVLLGDPSAIGRAENPAVCATVLAAINAQQIVTCEIVTLELLRSARNHHQVEEREAWQSTFHHVPVTRSVQRAALTALRELARRGAGYDHHFDRLAKVLHFRSVWLAPAGSLS